MDTGVYLIENRENGHRYVGGAVSIKKRWREHRRQLSEGRHHSRYLQRAWNKYGIDSFEFRPIIFCARENLLMYEQSAMDSMSPEYNIAPIAGSQLGYKHSEETRAKLRAARARNGFSPMKGRRHTEEAKRKISENRKGRGPSVYPQDRVRKAASAMAAVKSVMTEEKIREVRKLKASGLTAAQVAKIVGCTHHVVYDVCSGRCFSWVK